MPEGFRACMMYTAGSLKSKHIEFTAYFLLIRQTQQISVKPEFISVAKSPVKCMLTDI